MAIDRDNDKVSLKRHFVLPGVVLAIVEAVVIAVPLYTVFGDSTPSATLLRIALPVFAGAEIAWAVLMLTSLLPIHRANKYARRGESIPRSIAGAAYRATWNMPLWALAARTALWVGASAVAGAFLVRYAGWTSRHVIELAAMTAVHAFVVSAVRAIWYQAILARARARLFPAKPRLLRFADGYGRRMLLVVLVAESGTVAAVSAFIYYFVPVTMAQYLQIQTFFPVWVALATCVWLAVAWRSRRRINAYLIASGVATGHIAADGGSRAEAEATPVYRLAQLLPYRFAAASLALWAGAATVITYLANGRFRLELDDAVVIAGVILVIAVGAAIYEALWHREAMRPLIEHLTLRHRLPVRGIRTS
ncbi:MAG TPA: hypothetical protein VFG83_05440, partial [Kofleriaceae bacterium]|nr:hypothetical protein [Kofleriaceae bacterium]